jgi:hypothetical protein
MPDFDQLPLSRQLLARESFLAAKAKAGQVGDEEYGNIALEYCNFLYMNRKWLQRFKMWDRGLAGFVAALGECEQVKEHWLAAAFLQLINLLSTTDPRGKACGAARAYLCFFKGDQPLYAYFLRGVFQENETSLLDVDRDSIKEELAFIET